MSTDDEFRQRMRQATAIIVAEYDIGREAQEILVDNVVEQRWQTMYDVLDGLVAAEAMAMADEEEDEQEPEDRGRERDRDDNTIDVTPSRRRREERSR